MICTHFKYSNYLMVSGSTKTVLKFDCCFIQSNIYFFLVIWQRDLFKSIPMITHYRLGKFVTSKLYCEVCNWSVPRALKSVNKTDCGPISQTSQLQRTLMDLFENFRTSSAKGRFLNHASDPLQRDQICKAVWYEFCCTEEHLFRSKKLNLLQQS